MADLLAYKHSSKYLFLIYTGLEQLGQVNADTEFLVLSELSH